MIVAHVQSVETANFRSDMAGNKQNPQVGFLFPQRNGKLTTITVRQCDIEHQQINSVTVRFKKRQRTFAAVCFDNCAVFTVQDLTCVRAFRLLIVQKEYCFLAFPDRVHRLWTCPLKCEHDNGRQTKTTDHTVVRWVKSCYVFHCMKSGSAPNRHELEVIWRERLKVARSKYDSAVAEFRRVSAEQKQWPLPAPD